LPSYPRESIEFQPITVTIDGAAITTGVDIAITGRSERPTVWVPATVLDGKLGFMVGTYQPGDHLVWCRYTDNPEVPVILAGYFRIT